jgi:sialic acid synthase SpsE
MKNATLDLNGRLVGKDHAPLVIAEIGINHGGSLAVAKEMVDAARRAGAEVVKHQTHIVEDEMSEAAKLVKPGNAECSIYEIMESCALSSEDELHLKGYVERSGMMYLSTPFSRAAANFLAEAGVGAFKVGSGECNNLPLIDHICRFGKPMIISTGMNSLDAVAETVQLVRAHRVPYALLHTTNLYPTPHRLVRYGAMQQLMEAFPDSVVGLSDHTLGNNACLGAVALGASILERHFTDTRGRKGPDIACSMDEKELGELIRGSKEIFECRGGSKVAADEEAVTIRFAFATMVAIQDIEADEPLTLENVWVKRPGTGGIPARRFTEFLGKRAKVRIAKDQHLEPGDIWG